MKYLTQMLTLLLLVSSTLCMAQPTVTINCTDDNGANQTTIVAEATGSGAITFDWRADGVSISNGGDYAITYETGKSTLVISNATTHSNELIDCLVTDDDGTVASGSCTPLPVELTEFTASLIEKGVALNWQTATEEDNEGFEV